ncbi:MAG: DnaD domain protein [Thermoflexaceae bacterium]|nr:DnaD domain protein [Thermoflexaceae bacterium]
MKCLTLKADNRMDYTTVSNIFIDNYMPQANGEFVKIYLYLLRCMSDPDMDISISSIADRFDHTEKDVIRALRYFAGKGLISIEYGEDDELSAVTFLPINSEFTVIRKNVAPASSMPDETDTAKEGTSPDKAEVPAVNEPPAKPSYSPAQLKKLTSNEDISQLLYITQKYLGKTLTTSETNTILYLYDTLGFSPELIEYLIEYCVTNNHKSMRYIEKVALSWASDGIDTIQKAKANTNLYNSNVYSIMKAFGLNGRNPAEAEKKLISKWYEDYCFDNEIIIEACNRTIKAIHAPSFEYADSILTRWKNNNVTKLSDIASLEEQTPKKTMKIFNAKSAGNSNKFNDFPQRTYDFDMLEKQLMED